MKDIHYKFMSHIERRCNQTFLIRSCPPLIIWPVVEEVGLHAKPYNYKTFPQALLECMYISWFYGLDRLDDELEQRSGLTMNEFWYLMILIYDNTRYFSDIN